MHTHLPIDRSTQHRFAWHKRNCRTRENREENKFPHMYSAISSIACAQSCLAKLQAAQPSHTASSAARYHASECMQANCQAACSTLRGIARITRCAGARAAEMQPSRRRFRIVVSSARKRVERTRVITPLLITCTLVAGRMVPTDKALLVAMTNRQFWPSLRR